jgi:hypothetical protein
MSLLRLVLALVLVLVSDTLASYESVSRFEKVSDTSSPRSSASQLERVSDTVSGQAVASLRRGVRHQAAGVLYGVEVTELGQRLDPFQNLAAHHLLVGLLTARS